MEKEIRFFKKSERKLLLDAIDKFWKHDHIYVRNPAVLEHLVLNTPWRAELAGEENYSFVGMWVDGELVGLNGAIPQEGNILGTRVHAKAGTIWMTRKVEGKSINGLDMGDYVDELWQTKLHTGLGLSPIVERIERLRGSYVTPYMNRWVLAVDLEKTAEYLLVSSEMKQYIPHSLWVDYPQRYIVDVDDLSEERWDAFYADTVAPRTIGICRDYKFLKWRYMESPVLKYHILTIRKEDGEYLGLAVLRIEPVLDRTCHIGRVLEFLAFDPVAATQLASALVDFRRDVLMWDFYCLSDVTAFGLEAVGFRKLSPWSEKLQIPTRFHPIDHENMVLNVTVHLAEEWGNVVNPINSFQWYVTRGDGDQDRAN